MFVDEYFDALERIIQECGSIRSHSSTRDKRSDYVGFFKATLYFFDDSVLHIREFVFTKEEVIKDMYHYQYQDSLGKQIFRYDNTRHFPDLAGFPHHKHTSFHVISSNEPTIADVITEIILLLL